MELWFGIVWCIGYVFVYGVATRGLKKPLRNFGDFVLVCGLKLLDELNLNEGMDPRVVGKKIWTFSFVWISFHPLLGCKKIHSLTNFGRLYLLHTMGDWGYFYIVRFLLIRATHMQVCKLFENKSWRNPEVIFYFLGLIYF